MGDTYDLFISYRRNGGAEMAKLLRDLFIRDGYSVFFDEDVNYIGSLGGILEESIKRSRIVVLVISKGCFDNILEGEKSGEDNYWREVVCAIREKGGSCIIPVLTPEARSTKELPEINPELTLIKSLRYIRYKGELSHLMGGFYKDLKNCIVNATDNRTGSGGKTALYRKKPPLLIVAVVAVVLAGAGVWWFLSQNNLSATKDHANTDSMKYEHALAMMASTDADSLIEGYHEIEDLCRRDYVPAIYEKVITLGWNSDTESIRRKDILKIAYDETKAPIDSKVNDTVIILATRILDIGDTQYAKINMDISYMMCGYHKEKKFNIQDNKKAHMYLNVAQSWAEYIGDSAKLVSIKKAKESLF